MGGSGARASARRHTHAHTHTHTHTNKQTNNTHTHTHAPAGQIAAVSAVAALCSGLTVTMIEMASGLNGKTPLELDNRHNFAIFAGYILLNGVVNGAGLSVLTLCTQARAARGRAGRMPALLARACGQVCVRPVAKDARVQCV